MKTLLRCLLFLILLPGQEFVFSQHLESLKTIISSEASVPERQHLLDSLQSTLDPQDTSLMADFYHEVGVRWYYRELLKKTDQFPFLDSVIRSFERASQLKKSIYHLDTTSLAKSLYNLGFFSSVKADYMNAIEVYEEIVALGQKDRRMANAYRELGRLFGLTGDYYRALEMFEEMIRLGSKLKSGITVSDGYFGLIKTYAAIDPITYQDSIDLNFDRAESRLAKEDFELPYILKNAKANQLAELGQYPEAIAIYKTLLNIPNSSHLAQVHNNLGYNYILLNRLSLAKHHLSESIKLNDQYSFTYENLGDSWLAEGDFEQALVYYDSAIYLALEESKDGANFLTFSSTALNTLNYITSKGKALLTIYEQEQKSSYLEQALTTFSQADSLVDVIRFQSIEDQSRFFWRKQASELYINAIKACHLLQAPEQAYYFMEKNKAILLLEELSNERAREMARLPRSVVAREIDLKKQIYQLQARGVDKEEALTQVKKEYYVLIDSLVEVYPTYGKQKQQIDILPYADFKREYVSKEKLVIHFITSDTLSYGLITRPSGSQLYQISNDHHALADSVIRWQQQPLKTRSEANNYARSSAALLRHLIPAQYLSAGSSALLLLPDGILHELSFESLCMDATAVDHFLIHSHIVHYSPSISWLGAIGQRRRKTTEAVAAFAPVAFSSLPDLPKTEVEAQYISALLGGTAHLRVHATKQQFREDIAHHKIVHLATHANAPEGGDPWIAFYDSALTLTETYALPNQAELVVLGACNTSIGALRAGEGMISMTRGFFYSGTNSVISTLWSANDESTSALMMDFYEALQGGENKSTALHSAKKAFLKDAHGSLRSPYYWASLVLQGSDEPISKSTARSWAIPGFIVLLLVAFIITRKLRSTTK